MASGGLNGKARCLHEGVKGALPSAYHASIPLFVTVWVLQVVVIDSVPSNVDSASTTFKYEQTKYALGAMEGFLRIRSLVYRFYDFEGGQKLLRCVKSLQVLLHAANLDREFYEVTQPSNSSATSVQV